MKNGEAHSPKMTKTVKSTLIEAIKNRRLISPYVFTDNKGQPYSTNEVSMAFNRACKRAHIVNFRFHDLRHDYATLLLNEGASESQVQHNLGVSDPRMTKRYAHLLPENRNVADKIEGKGTAAILLSEDNDDEDFTTILRQSGEK